jgi:hypothetical protein
MAEGVNYAWGVDPVSRMVRIQITEGLMIPKDFDIPCFVIKMLAADIIKSEAENERKTQLAMAGMGNGQLGPKLL